MTTPLIPQPERFHDGGPPDGQGIPDAPPVIALERTRTMPPQEFRMTRRIGYRDRRLGDLLVPADPATFTTDLTSVPSVFLWLVPRTGQYLPAVLVHDGLVGSTPERPTHIGPEGIDVETANRVLRDALADTGTGVVRRWLMWTAVTIALMVTGDRRWSTGTTWRWRVTSLGTIAVLCLLGLWTTADLLDIAVPHLGGVPWMGEGPLWTRLLTGAAGAIVVPFVLALGWGRFRVAGMVAGTALALLLHVTVVVALTGLYRASEWVCTRTPRLAAVLAAAVVVLAVVVLIGALASVTGAGPA